MRTNAILLIGIFSLMALNSCKKSSTKPALANTSTTKSLSTTPALVGTWFVTKDSIQTYSSGILIPNLVQPRIFDKNDFVTFNKDSTAVISNNAAFSAFYTDYQSSNADGVLRVNQDIVANLHFKYSVSFEGYSINSGASQQVPQPVYGLTADGIVVGVNRGYGITVLSATSMMLEHDVEIPTVQHDFKVMEYIYLTKQL